MKEKLSCKGARGHEVHGDTLSANLKPAVDADRPQRIVKNLKTRRSGIPGVGNIRWGEHLCAFYNGKQELLKLVVPFIQAGLQDNEFCMWITGEPVTERDAFETLEAVLPQAHEYLIRKQLEILPSQRWYGSSGAFNAQMVLENWLSKAQYAEAEGFAGIRITDNLFWLHSEEEWAQFGSYEKKVEASIQSERVLALCTYPVERCSPEHMLQTLSNHGSTLLKRVSEWQRWGLRRQAD